MSVKSHFFLRFSLCFVLLGQFVASLSACETESGETTLLGTVIYPEKPSANVVVVQDNSYNSRAYSIGEVLCGGNVQAIERGRITINKRGALSYLEFEEKSSASSDKDGKQVKAAHSRTSSEVNPEILASVFSAHLERGLVAGASVQQKVNFKRSMGGRLKKGDIIRAINGKKIDNYDILQQLPTLLMTLPVVKLEVERNQKHLPVFLSLNNSGIQ